MSDKLAREMQPIINNSISEAGAVEAYDKVMAQYKNIPFMPDLKANLVVHVTNKGVDGIFHYIAKEEAAIRNNPAKRTTEILQRVFGSQ